MHKLCSVEIIGDSMETNLEESIASYPSVDHLVTDVHPSNMEVSVVEAFESSFIV